MRVPHGGGALGFRQEIVDLLDVEAHLRRQHLDGDASAIVHPGVDLAERAAAYELLDLQLLFGDSIGDDDLVVPHLRLLGWSNESADRVLQRVGLFLNGLGLCRSLSRLVIGRFLQEIWLLGQRGVSTLSASLRLEG